MRREDQGSPEGLDEPIPGELLFEKGGEDRHGGQVYLELNEIEQRFTIKVRRPQTNSFVERFNRTVFDKFPREALWENSTSR